jgi:hypothetical protein
MVERRPSNSADVHRSLRMSSLSCTLAHMEITMPRMLQRKPMTINDVPPQRRESDMMPKPIGKNSAPQRLNAASLVGAR